MQFRENLKLFFLFITAIATCIVAYATYRTYLDQSEESTLTLEAYKIEGTKEVSVADSSSLTLKKINSENGFDDYELPIQVSNYGNKDVDGILLHVDVDNGELIVPQTWTTGTYADNPRYFYSISSLRPSSTKVFRDVKIRIKNTTHEAKLRWAILAKRTYPPDGTLVFHF